MDAPPSLKYTWHDIHVTRRTPVTTTISLRCQNVLEVAENLWLRGLTPVILNFPSEWPLLFEKTALGTTLDAGLLPVLQGEVVYSPAVPVLGAKELWIDVLTCPDESEESVRLALGTAAQMGNTAVVLPTKNKHISHLLLAHNGIFNWYAFAIRDPTHHDRVRRYLEAACEPDGNDRRPNQ